MAALTLDLHGRRLEEAVAEVTMYFDRIRRTYTSINNAAASSSLNVTIITGKGSHSSQGPVLRSAIQKLLIKRGMSYTLEHHKGAFTVDALSGWDLYAAGPSISSKVLVSDHQEFHVQAACKKQASYGASFQQAATGNNGPIASKSQEESSVSLESTEPLPKHVALEMEALSLAKRQSMIDAQQQKNEEIKLRKEKRLEMKKAIEESRAQAAVYDRCKEDEEAELQKALALSCQETNEYNNCHYRADHLKIAIEQSLLEEQERQSQEIALYEENLHKALEVSAQVSPKQEELDLLRILELSLKEKVTEDERERDTMQKAIELSKQSDGLQLSDDSEVYQLSVEENNIVDKQQTQIRVRDAAWFYIDPQDKVQGPFEPDMMRAWLAAGYFNGDLRISQQQFGPFFSLSTFFPFYLSTAFVPDVD